jgi:hypothetical protein
MSAEASRRMRSSCGVSGSGLAGLLNASAKSASAPETWGAAKDDPVTGS